MAQACKRSESLFAGLGGSASFRSGCCLIAALSLAACWIIAASDFPVIAYHFKSAVNNIKVITETQVISRNRSGLEFQPGGYEL